MHETQEPLEIFWDAILSREPKKIREAFTPLNAENRQNTLKHLNRMATEEGWHPEQKASAQAALKALENLIH